MEIEKINEKIDKCLIQMMFISRLVESIDFKASRYMTKGNYRALMIKISSVRHDLEILKKNLPF